jgi:hypothetical protein
MGHIRKLLVPSLNNGFKNGAICNICSFKLDIGGGWGNPVRKPTIIWKVSRLSGSSARQFFTDKSMRGTFFIQYKFIIDLYKRRETHFHLIQNPLLYVWLF